MRAAWFRLLLRLHEAAANRNTLIPMITPMAIHVAWVGADDDVDEEEVGAGFEVGAVVRATVVEERTQQLGLN